MKRLAVIPSDPLEEYEKMGFAASLEEYYNPLGWFDEVYCLTPLESKERFEYGMKIIPTKDKQLRSRIKDLNINVVRVYGGNWPCDMGCTFKVKGVPVVVSVHDRRPDWLSNSIKKADIVFGVSEEVVQLVISKGVKSQYVWHLPNRVNFEVMRSLPIKFWVHLDTKYPFKYRIVTLGRKSQEKNLDTLIKALKILGEDYCLLAIGKGDDSEYRELAKENNVLGRCFFIETVLNTELPLYFSMASCMCNPSRTEAMSSALIEAMACSAVVVTSEVAASSVNLKHMENGLIVRDHENANELAQWIKKASEDQNVRELLKGNARKSMECFSKESVDKMEIGYYKKVFEKLMSKNFSPTLLERMTKHKW